MDIYGKVEQLKGDKSFIPFRFQGMYYDTETELCYVRHRYYSCDTGTFISQDPIRLAGGSRLYGYVHDTNAWIDPLGLEREPIIFLSDGGGVVHPKTVNTSHPHGVYTIKATGSYAEDRKALAEAAKISDPGKNWRAHHIGYDSATNTMQMQFVHKDYHSYPHVGGADEFKQDTGFKYGSDDAIAEAKKRNKMLNKKTKSKTKYACK